MNEKRASLEMIAPTVDEAIEKGLAELGMSEDAVKVEVLDAGSRGVLGLGSRLARVRLTMNPVIPEAVRTPIIERGLDENTQSKAPTEFTEIEQKVENDEYALDVARDTVIDLLERMKVHAEVTSRFGDLDESRNRKPVIVEIHGEDLSILIGPRAETLNALQYITSLIVGKELGRSLPLQVDVEGYRARHAQQIRQLAHRMADQAVKTGRRQVLEPMPASERRLVHMELRDYPGVTTESVGDDPHRKVTIIPK